MDPDPHSEKLLDPDWDPDPYKVNADPQPWGRGGGMKNVLRSTIKRSVSDPSISGQKCFGFIFIEPGSSQNLNLDPDPVDPWIRIQAFS